MKLKYYGTACYEGIPAMFCKCEVCEKSRRAGGKNIRSRVQATVDDTILIDFSPDTLIHTQRDGLDLSRIYHCIITHGHSDHFYPDDIASRRHHYTNNNDTPFTVYATQPAIDMAWTADNKPGPGEEDVLRYVPVVPFEPFFIEDYEITPLLADHAPNKQAVFYAITRGGKSILYAHDTGVFPEETFAYIEAQGMHFGIVSLDCTSIRHAAYRGHMGLDANRMMKERLLSIGAADERTQFIAHHFSHNGGATHDELVPLAAELGLLVSYDGMEIEI